MYGNDGGGQGGSEECGRGDGCEVGGDESAGCCWGVCWGEEVSCVEV